MQQTGIVRRNGLYQTVIQPWGEAARCVTFSHPTLGNLEVTPQSEEGIKDLAVDILHLDLARQEAEQKFLTAQQQLSQTIRMRLTRQTIAGLAGSDSDPVDAAVEEVGDFLKTIEDTIERTVCLLYLLDGGNADSPLLEQNIVPLELEVLSAG